MTRTSLLPPAHPRALVLALLFGLTTGATGTRAQEGAPPQDTPSDAPAGAAGEGEAEAAPEIAAPAARVPLPARYRDEAEEEELLARWTANGLAERLRLGESAGGRALTGIVLAAPGPVPVAERTTVLLVAGLDGTSLSGSEAAVRVVDTLLASMDRLPPWVAVVVVPWANPDGLARTRVSVGAARNDARVDDDQDGRFDEDGPDDLDGDGSVLSMLVADPDGPLARAGDGRFLRPATPADAERWRLVPEGRDDDGDGRFNEDGPGGIALDSDFPFGWEPGAARARVPLSQPESRALAGLVQARRVAVVLVLQGNHGAVAVPGGTDATRVWLADALDRDGRAWTELATLLGGDDAAPARDLAAASGGPRPGHPIDWFYAARGVLAAEWSVWGPEVGRPRERAAVPREGSFAERARQQLPLAEGQGLAGVDPVERRWARWLDDTRGGIGFVDWLPVELEGARALVGGWEPRTRLNPPEELLPAVVDGVGERVLGLIEALPTLRVETVRREREGGVVALALRVAVDGRLPSGVGPLEEGGGVQLTLRLPDGAELLAGEARRALGHVQAGVPGPRLEWLIAAKEHAVVEVELDSPWRARQVVEVRL